MLSKFIVPNTQQSRVRDRACPDQLFGKDTKERGSRGSVRDGDNILYRHGSKTKESPPAPLHNMP